MFTCRFWLNANVEVVVAWACTAIGACAKATATRNEYRKRFMPAVIASLGPREQARNCAGFCLVSGQFGKAARRLRGPDDKASSRRNQLHAHPDLARQGALVERRGQRDVLDGEPGGVE